MSWSEEGRIFQCQGKLISRFATLLESGKYSDLTIVCRSRQFRVHRNVLCTASKFFAAACDGAFQEAQIGKLDLSADDPNVVERFLSFLYTANYNEDDKDDTKETTGQGESSVDSVANASSMDSGHVEDSALPPLSALSVPQTGQKRKAVDEEKTEGMAEYASERLNDVLVYALADKYDVKDLKNLAIAKFQRSKDWEGWEDEDILTILRIVYETTPRTDRGLRDEILKIFSCHCDTLMDNPRLISMLDGDGQLARDILKTTKKALDRKATGLTLKLEKAHKIQMQAKDEAHRQAIQSKDVASQQAMQTKDREHKSVVEEHRKTVQCKEEAFRKTLQAKDKTIYTAQKWAREEVRVLREMISKYAMCRACGLPLELTNAEPVIFGNVHTRANLECRYCHKS
ncbi:MAG: hypothetical protein LQ350_004791 [Teloschistes chrysophthalmus]|nr:MAG: hypothetical protein LQ350_004791 [Niorma chrysophthalma]